MLQVKLRVKYSKSDSRIIESIKIESGGNFIPTSWDIDADNDDYYNLKQRIRAQLLLIQEFRCAYCMKFLIGDRIEVDHFAPKSRHPQFSFTPTNLFVACTMCNSKANKGEFNTIAHPVNSIYKGNTFKLVHPHYHVVNDHVKFINEERTILDLTSSSPLGYFTIKKLKLDDPYKVEVRINSRKSHSYYRDTENKLNELVKLAIAYKKT